METPEYNFWLSPMERLQAGCALRTKDVARLLDCSTMTVLRRFAEMGVTPARVGRGRGSSWWRASDVSALLNGGGHAASP